MPEPLHPAVVHFPIAFTVLLPIFAAGALWAIHRGARPHLAWLFPLGLAVALSATTFIAVRTGEAEEDRVEEVVGESLLHEHEEAGERFLVLAVVLTLVATVGLFRGAVGTAGRLIASLGSLVLVVAAVEVGAAGGELVYHHGAAAVYQKAGPAAPIADRDRRGFREDDD